MSISQPEHIRQFVRAGAGAGKTWNLTRQVVKRALAYHDKHNEWPRTVMTTFTRKATQELKERLLTYCLQEEPGALEFVQSSSYLTITTMHGLFDSFLRRYGFAMGLASQYKVVDSQRADFWRKKVVKDLLIHQKKSSELLVSYDISRLLQILKAYEDIYWYKSYHFAQAELMESICFDLSSHYSQLLQQAMQNWHAYVEGEKWEDYCSYINDLSKILKDRKNWSEQRKLLEKTYGRVTKPRKSKNNPGLPKEIDDSLKKILEKIKSLSTDPEYDPENWHKANEYFQSFSAFADEYMKQLFQVKLQEASLEANDLENFALKLVTEKSEYAGKFCEDWDMWFIDEFQDTSPKQIEIIDQFVASKPCYIVGDPQQSIYLFRGSRSEVFFEKQESMEKAGDEVTQLQDNYRSQAHLLDYINEFFPALSDQFKPMNAKVEAEEKSSVCISHIEDNDEDIEVLHILSQMKQLLDEGASPKDICLLARTNSYLDKMQKALMKAGFPVISHSSSNYYSRREIIDALSLLHLLMNPWDDVNLMTWMRSPWMSLSDQKLIEIIGEEKNKFWLCFKNYFSNNEDYEPGQWLLKAMKEKREWGLGWVLRKLLISFGFVDYTHKIDSTGRREANLWKFLNMVEKISREPGGSLLKLVQEGSFVTSLDDVGQNTDASSPVEPDKINLMTIHASKGLQFKYVFIPFMNKKMRSTTHANFCSIEEKKLCSFRVPLGEYDQFIGTPLEKYYLKNISLREEEESLRVLYVGMTRAESQLYLSWTGKSEKASWSGFVEKQLAAKEMGSHVLFEKIDKAERVIYQDKKYNTQVPQPLTDIQRIYISPQREIVDNDFAPKKTDILEGQKIRWQGVVLHRLFESLKSHDLETVKSLAGRWLPHDSEQALKALEFVYKQEQMPLAEIIKQGHVEWGYQKQKEGQLIERRIDLWAIHEDTLWIVDYKTGSSRYKEKAFKQLREYGEALKEYLAWDKSIKLAAVYPFEKNIEIVSE